MLLAVLLLLFVLVVGDTVFLLNALVMNVGDYFSNFISLSLDTYAYRRPTDWLNAWTVFFWAWWIAWGPFVGLFLARISRGRTIREYCASEKGPRTRSEAHPSEPQSLIRNSYAAFCVIKHIKDSEHR